MLDILKKAFCCQSTKRESPLSAYSLESTRRPENAIAEQPQQELHPYVLNLYAKLLDGCLTETLSTPPTVFEESAQEGWPELAPDAPLRWQALIRPHFLNKETESKS